MLVKPRYHYVALLYNDQSILFFENHGPANSNEKHTKQWWLNDVGAHQTLYNNNNNNNDTDNDNDNDNNKVQFHHHCKLMNYNKFTRKKR